MHKQYKKIKHKKKQKKKKSRRHTKDRDLMPNIANYLWLTLEREAPSFNFAVL